VNYKLLSFYFLIIVAAQFVAWYQSNSLLLWDWLKNNYIPVVVCTSPVVGLCFAYGTKVGHDVMGSLWAVRFSAFAIGYLVFIFLAWYHLGESPFSPKNIVTSLLCFSLLGVQVFWK
tara:strand:- start:847 stop:1197 length:351 start_codon:yes stop_codon:yes gene_type:complete